MTARQPHIGEPCATEPHARFDEGEQGNGSGQSAESAAILFPTLHYASHGVRLWRFPPSVLSASFI
jgi:hypothetical protein